MYQTCTEFGFYQTSDSDNQPFGKLFPLKYVTVGYTITLNSCAIYIQSHQGHPTRKIGK